MQVHPTHDVQGYRKAAPSVPALLPEADKGRRDYSD